MSDREKSIPSSPFEARVCFFRHSALLNLPEALRVTLAHLGEGLTNAALEIYGTAPEAPDGLEETRRLVLSISKALQTAGDQLRELDESAVESEIVAEELRIRRFCGRVAPQVAGICSALVACVEG